MLINVDFVIVSENKRMKHVGIDSDAASQGSDYPPPEKS